MESISECTPLKVVQGPRVQGPVVCVVMDGIGIGCGDAGDAVAQARTPTLDHFKRTSLSNQLFAHGRSVGMPSDDDMGNSEVGHNALGAGRIFDQGAKLVAAAIKSGELFEGTAWQHVIGNVVRHRSTLHFIGLLSDGNVHSHIDHLRAMLQRAAADGVQRAFVHVLLDGRDVPKTSAHLFLDQLESVLADINRHNGREFGIASGGGRMFVTMDRYEADWDMVKRGWQTHVRGIGRGFASARAALETFRQENPGIGDQDLPAFVVQRDGRAIAPIMDGDSVIAFNFRGDRMLELTQAFEDEVFNKFERGPRPDVCFAGMTLYDGDTHRPRQYLVAPPQIRCTLGELLCDAGVTQLACSETQKFGHVTYFWNGNRSGAFDARLEKYIEVPSLPAPFDAHPEMRAEQITDAVIAELARSAQRFTRINYANGDMVGHTGNFSATVAAVEAVDHALGRLSQAVLRAHGALIITADHGNADEMAERDKKTGVLLRDGAGHLVPKTSHSLNPVPFYVVLAEQDRSRFALAEVDRPGLGHVAATCATLLGFARPEGFLPSMLRPML